MDEMVKVKNLINNIIEISNLKEDKITATTSILVGLRDGMYNTNYLDSLNYKY
jgi:hypothetical protein